MPTQPDAPYKLKQAISAPRVLMTSDHARRYAKKNGESVITAANREAAAAKAAKLANPIGGR